MLCAIEVTNVDGEHKIIYTIFSDYVAAQMDTQKKKERNQIIWQLNHYNLCRNEKKNLHGIIYNLSRPPTLIIRILMEILHFFKQKTNINNNNNYKIHIHIYINFRLVSLRSLAIFWMAIDDSIVLQNHPKYYYLKFKSSNQPTNKMWKNIPTNNEHIQYNVDQVVNIITIINWKKVDDKKEI